MLSPDGKWYWDGQQWRTTSSDRRWWWNGSTWQSMVPPRAAPTTASPINRKGRFMLVGAVVVVAALAVVTIGSRIGSSVQPSPAQQSPGTWTLTGTMAFAHQAHTATLLSSGKVLVAGGFADLATVSDRTEIFDPATRKWTAASDMSTARWGHTATLLTDGRVIVAGGTGGTSHVAPLPSAEVYDPATDTWASTAAMASARNRHTATLLRDGKVLVVGGERYQTDLASAELYDPRTGSWSPTSSMTHTRSSHTATLLPNGEVLVVGGTNAGRNESSAEIYDPSTKYWRNIAQMSRLRHSHTATLLPDGQVLVAGGYGGRGPEASAELYDSAAGVWKAVGNMRTSRAVHSAVLLANGTVLVAGGFRRGVLDNYKTSSAEVFDPATLTWLPTQNMHSVRTQFTTTLLTDGEVIVAGGAESSSLFSDRPSTSEFYRTNS